MTSHERKRNTTPAPVRNTLSDLAAREPPAAGGAPDWTRQTSPPRHPLDAEISRAQAELNTAHEDRDETAREAIAAHAALREHITRVAPQVDYAPIRALLREFGRASRAHERASERSAAITGKLNDLTERRRGRRR